ncbi:MAG TPA: STAS domain-containing protein [Terriglobales bacterium]|jgi:anti-sigma B factor antagonist|nr:STAS domain-containing protein [Terriglobales bacterium]
MRATLRLLKSLFMTNVFSWEAAATLGPSLTGGTIAATEDIFSPGAADSVNWVPSVAVKELPADMIRDDAQKFLREVEIILNHDRPHLVFDLSNVKCLDSGGVDILLRCLRGASKRDRDLKLAAVSPELVSVLEWTKAGRMFEVFESPSDAVLSFRQQRHLDQPSRNL